MKKNLFKDVATMESNEKWGKATSRDTNIYTRPNEIRTPYERDYTRILHCTAYRRLKHKTQVFFATTNDHICTRIEHVNHVNSVSKTISNHLGLNSELVDAISIGHDLGHAPFGHKGEETLRSILKDKIPGSTFWHEKNSLRFVDLIETLEGPDGKHHNLDLTYAVRDGIICHCGEVDESNLTPRDEFIDLYSIYEPSQVQPYTWEGCIVKVSDKIAYLGRDIEDAITLGILSISQLEKLDKILTKHGILDSVKINNTVLIHNFIIDLCQNSNPSDGIRFSEQKFLLMNEIKSFCYKHIYKHPKVERYKKFVEHILRDLFTLLVDITENILNDKSSEGLLYKRLNNEFRSYLMRYAKQFAVENEFSSIKKIYDLEKETDRYIACVDFLSGMTDQYAIKRFKESITFES